MYGIDGKEINCELAYSCFEQAKEIGMADANFYLGLLADWYAYPERNFEQARNYYEACGDNPYVKLSLGYLYLNGQGVEENKDHAEELFQFAVDGNCMEGYVGLGEIAYAEEDYEKALDAFNRALEGTEQVYITCAMRNLGSLYEEGNGVEQDYGKAIEWYEKAADLNDASAMVDIAWFYHMGESGETDYLKAIEWYERAADLGNAQAMNLLGVMYADGEGIEQDFNKALELWDKAAELGNSYAKDNAEGLRKYMQ